MSENKIKLNVAGEAISVDYDTIKQALDDSDHAFQRNRRVMDAIAEFIENVSKSPSIYDNVVVEQLPKMAEIYFETSFRQ